MKHLITIFFAASLAVLAGSCGTMQPVSYANREWHISDYYGQIIDRDTTYRMTFGNVIIPQDMAIISCADSAAKYPGMERFIADILKTTGLENDEVLFYSPAHGKMFVRLKNEPPAKRPSSVTGNMQCLADDERPYTMWVYDDDVEAWHRQPGEMYTYTYFDKQKQRILVVDFYDYGDTPIAQIFIMQSRNKMTDRMELPTQKQWWDFSKHRLRDYERDVEVWSHWVEGHRQNAFDNYRIGQELLKLK